MVSDYRCFYCLARSFEKLLEKESITAEAKNSFTIDMINLYLAHQDKLLTPDFVRDIHSKLREYTNNPDSYKSEKRQSNIEAMEMIPGMEKIINSSSDPFMTALRLAIAGNIIDFAANQTFDLERTVNRSLITPFAIDHSEQLRSSVRNTESILYLGDNAGEIVFDKLFIRTMDHNNVTFAVRGRPVLNDATKEDAHFINMYDTAKVISNGYDAPSTIVGKSSEEFRSHFKSASLIISKGQGNLEGLLQLNDKRIFFLLMVKCDVMAEFLKVEKNSFVVFNSHILNGSNI